MRLPIWAWALAAVTGVYLLARQAAPEVVKGVEKDIMTTVNGLIAGFEGFRSKPYLDEAGLWTIGYGHLIVAGDGYWSPSNTNGKDKVTKVEAKQQQQEDTAQARAAVNNNVRVALNASQTEALLSLAYNIGSGNFSRSTIVKRLNEGDYQAAADQFLVWNEITDKNTGQLVVSNGLVNRREKERALFLA